MQEHVFIPAALNWGHRQNTGLDLSNQLNNYSRLYN